MKFLVFNIVVLLSLGYLVTGQKNQSVGNWLDALPEKILNSYEKKDLANLLPGKKAEHVQTSSQNVSHVESLASNQPESNEIPKSRISAEKLELLIEETVRKSIAKQTDELKKQPNNKVKSRDSENLKAHVTQTANTSKQADEQGLEKVSKSDKEFARAFAEFSKIDQTKKVEAEVPDVIGNKDDQDGSEERTKFMSAYERRLALSDFIQKMQIVSVERGGF